MSILGPRRTRQTQKYNSKDFGKRCQGKTADGCQSRYRRCCRHNNLSLVQKNRLK
jgi:hypothetical protein